MRLQALFSSVMVAVAPLSDGFLIHSSGLRSTGISLNMLGPQSDQPDKINKPFPSQKSGGQSEPAVARRLPYPILLNRRRQTSPASSSSTPPPLSATAAKGGGGSAAAGAVARPSNRYSSWRLAPLDYNGGPFEHNKYAVRKFTELYTQRSDTYFQSNIIYTWNIVLGLVQHRRKYGSPLCPCRQYKNKIAEVHSAYWNCPCVPMRERKECACLLFLTPDSPFVGEKQTFTDDEVRKTYFTNRIG